MIGRFRNFIKAEELLGPGDSCLVGVSGGADSVCLFLLLLSLSKEMDFSVEAMHVNHCIRGEESDADEKFVLALCERENVPCHVRRIDVPALARREKIGTEEAARMARRRLYYEKAAEGKKPMKVALAHHSDDVAETMLLSLVRGTGIDGLCSMRPKAMLPSPEGKTLAVELIRPLLFSGREEIESFLREKGEDWRTDSTNLSDEYTRNRLRHRVLPLLCGINPKAREHMAHTAEILYGLKTLKDSVTLRFLSENTDAEGGLSRKALGEAEPSLAREALHSWISSVYKDVSFVQVMAVLSLAEGRGGRRVDLNGALYVESSYERLYIRIRAEEGLKAAQPEFYLRRLLPGESKKLLFGGFEFDFFCEKTKSGIGYEKDYFSICVNYDKIGEICVRFPEEGDRMPLSSSGGRKRISRIMIDEKVPREKRSRLPVLCSGEDVFWIVGLKDSPAYFVDEGTRQLLWCKAREVS